MGQRKDSCVQVAKLKNYIQVSQLVCETYKGQRALDSQIHEQHPHILEEVTCHDTIKVLIPPWFLDLKQKEFSSSLICMIRNQGKLYITNIHENQIVEYLKILGCASQSTPRPFRHHEDYREWCSTNVEPEFFFFFLGDSTNSKKEDLYEFNISGLHTCIFALDVESVTNKEPDD